MRRLIPFVLALAFAACGDDPADTGEPFQETFTGTIVGGETVSHTVETPRSGTLRAVLTWPDGDIDLDLYLTDGECTGYPPAECQILDESVAFTGTQETVQRTVSAGQEYKVWVDSWSSEDSTYEIDVTID